MLLTDEATCTSLNVSTTAGAGPARVEFTVGTLDEDADRTSVRFELSVSTALKLRDFLGVEVQKLLDGRGVE
jgi:hypothetical protein